MFCVVIWDLYKQHDFIYALAFYYAGLSSSIVRGAILFDTGSPCTGDVHAASAALLVSINYISVLKHSLSTSSTNPCLVVGLTPQLPLRKTVSPLVQHRRIRTHTVTQQLSSH